MNVEDQLQTFRMMACGECRHRVLDDVAKAEVHDFQFEFARFDFGKVEDLIQQFEQSLRGVVDRFEVVALRGVQRGFDREFRHADDAVDRRPDLMAHHGEECALGDVGRRGLLGELADSRVRRFEFDVRFREPFVREDEGVVSIEQCLAIGASGFDHVLQCLRECADFIVPVAEFDPCPGVARGDGVDQIPEAVKRTADIAEDVACERSRGEEREDLRRENPAHEQGEGVFFKSRG